MRTTSVLLITLCLAMAYAETSNSKLNSLLQMQARSKDAVDSARQVIQDLKNKNVDDQARADAIHERTLDRMNKQIADFTAVADANKKAGDDATAHRKYIENEIEVTNQYLVWIRNRRDAINKRRETLREQRCYGVQMFVKALKEHDEALKVVALLKEDVVGIVQQHSGEVNFAQFKDVTDKLAAYTHLFNDQAMKEFAQLTENGDHAAQAVDQETAEYDERARDNQKGQLELDMGPSGSDDRDLGQKFIDLINRLEQHLKDSIKNMEENEIQASWDLATWLQDSQAELNHLDAEEERKKIYIDKLLIAIVAAKAEEDKTWEIYFKSATVLNDALDEKKAVIAAYEAERNRRNEENVILDECLRMFDEQVAIMNKGIRAKVDDHSDDGQFNNDSDISRRTGRAAEASAGRVADQVQAAADQRQQNE